MNKANVKYAGRNNFSGKVNKMLILFYVISAIIFLRLAQIQIFKHGFYKAMAQDQHEFLEKTFPKRGEIFIRDAASKRTYPVAVNKEMNLVYAVPKIVENKSETAGKISDILKLEKDRVFEALNKPNDPYEVIAHKVSDDDAEKIRKEKIKGIEITPEIVRYYPSKSMAANIIGFMGYRDDKRVGQYGVEGYFNESLEGSMGFLEIEKDVSGSWISIGSKSGTLPQDGDDIVLTIDQTIQYVAEKKLKEAVEKWGAEAGNVIIIDPKTGDVIAMAQYPSFDPNEYFKEKNLETFLNSNIHNVYEPGSIEKTITMAIGLETGKVTQNTTYVDTGSVIVDGWTIKNSDGKAHGSQSMIQVLENSLNTGTIFVQQKVGKEDFLRYLKNFDLDSLTGIELNGEAAGSLENLKIKNDVNYATASFGQGISVTPLSILMAISSLANDGKLMRPNIISEIIHSGGKTEKMEPKYVRKTVSAKTANIISAMMVSVVENGHAKGAKIKGYKIAGKTGTAQIPKKEGRGYEEEATIHTFVGFGPIPNPRFSVLVKLDKPKAKFAESTAIPVFRELAEELINYYNISPTEDLE